MSLAFASLPHAVTVSPVSPQRRTVAECRSESSHATVFAAISLGLYSGRRRLVKRQANITGPGWTDELARIFDPREEGPRWQPEFGYSGRPRLRLLLDAEDICHSYAKAKYLQTGKWTGPLSEGIEKALDYGAWGGGEPEEVNPGRKPNEPDMTPPEMLTFVGMPADLIEAVKPGDLVDGYPETLRQSLQNVVLSEDGYFINGFLQSLQEDNRLLTWTRPARLPGGQPRPNALLTQKHYESGRTVSFRSLTARPVLLSQVMGAETGLKIGDAVEALKPGRFFKDTWIPSMWKSATVVAVNYDGSYDLQFEMKHGPYREQRMKGLKGKPTLSLRRNERFKEYAADHMPASFRLFQEMNYQLSVTPNNIRMPGMLDRIANMQDTDATQDWYLCTSKNFLTTGSKSGPDVARLDEFSRRFIFSYRWVPTGEGLRFEPVPNTTQAQSLRACHKETAMQFANAAKIDEDSRRRIRAYKAEMKQFEEIIGDLRAKPHRPRRPAGPRVKAR